MRPIGIARECYNRGAHEVYVAISPLEAYETQSPTTPIMNSAIVWQIHRMPCALENYTASRYWSVKAMMNTEVAVSRVGIMITPNQPKYRRLLVDVMNDANLSQGESERSERSDTEDLTDERFKVAQEPSSRNRSQEDASEEGCAARILTAPVASDIRDQFVHKYNWEALEE